MPRENLVLAARIRWAVTRRDMSASQDTPEGGRRPSGQGRRNRGEEFVVMVNAVAGGVGSVYMATQSTAIAALMLGGLLLLGMGIPRGRRGSDQ